MITCLAVKPSSMKIGLPLALGLIHLAQRRSFIHAPAQELCAVPESAAGEMIVLVVSEAESLGVAWVAILRCPVSEARALARAALRNADAARDTHAE